MNPVTISLIALIVSGVSLIFALFQFNRNQGLIRYQKINEIMVRAFELKRSSQKFKHLIETTDDIDSHEEAINAMNTLIENTPNVLNNPKTKMSEIYLVEQRLLKTILNFDLLKMQVDEQIRFNSECSDFDKKQNAS